MVTQCERDESLVLNDAIPRDPFFALIADVDEGGRALSARL